MAAGFTVRLLVFGTIFAQLSCAEAFPANDDARSDGLQEPDAAPMPDSAEDAPLADAGLDAGLDAADTTVPLASHLLLSEIVVQPSGAEFIEIYNPTDEVVNLGDYYLTDRVDYYLVVTGSLPTSASDFLARFPSGASIAPGEYQTISIAGATSFQSIYGAMPTYELSATSPSVADMRPGVSGSIGGNAGLTDTGEPILLFYWDGVSDLVKDVDYLLYGTGQGANGAVDKTLISEDGPDANTTPTQYAPDRAGGMQTPMGAHAAGGSLERCDLTEAGETHGGGAGITGDIESSEPWASTWKVNANTGSLRTPNGPAAAGFCN